MEREPYVNRDNVPKGFEHILRDEPNYCGFLRGRVVRLNGRQLIVVYCRSEALAEAGSPVEQFVKESVLTIYTFPLLDRLPPEKSDGSLTCSDQNEQPP